MDLQGHPGAGMSAYQREASQYCFFYRPRDQRRMGTYHRRSSIRTIKRRRAETSAYQQNVAFSNRWSFPPYREPCHRTSGSGERLHISDTLHLRTKHEGQQFNRCLTNFDFGEMVPYHGIRSFFQLPLPDSSFWLSLHFRAGSSFHLNV